MNQEERYSIERAFEGLDDPRAARNQEHKFIEILAIAICGVICGAEDAEDYVGIAEFGRAKQEWLQEFLELPIGGSFGRWMRSSFSTVLSSGYGSSAS